jgi:hypothetical protein
MARPNFMQFGPDMPVVPIGDFSRMSLTEKQWADAWRICGPSAEQNMRRGWKRPPLELWQVIASAYLEGLHHGASIERERHDNRDTGQAVSGMVAVHESPYWPGD